MKFGEYIKNRRKELGLTIREAAEKIGISHPYLSQLENEKTKNPTLDVLKKISVGLNVSYLNLLDMIGYFNGINDAQLEELRKRQDEIRKRRQELLKSVNDTEKKFQSIKMNLKKAKEEITNLHNESRANTEQIEKILSGKLADTVNQMIDKAKRSKAPKKIDLFDIIRYENYTPYYYGDYKLNKKQISFISTIVNGFCATMTTKKSLNEKEMDKIIDLIDNFCNRNKIFYNDEKNDCR